MYNLGVLRYVENRNKTWAPSVAFLWQLPTIGLQSTRLSSRARVQIIWRRNCPTVALFVSAYDQIRKFSFRNPKIR